GVRVAQLGDDADVAGVQLRDLDPLLADGDAEVIELLRELARRVPDFLTVPETMRNKVTSPTCGSETVLNTCAASGPGSSAFSVRRSALPHFCASTGGVSCGAGHSSTSLFSSARVPYVSSAAPQNSGNSSPFVIPAFIAAIASSRLISSPPR